MTTIYVKQVCCLNETAHVTIQFYLHNKNEIKKIRKNTNKFLGGIHGTKEFHYF